MVLLQGKMDLTALGWIGTLLLPFLTLDARPKGRLLR
jgi:hypothetical protein